MINVYSDNYQLALKYLKDIKANLHNILVMAGVVATTSHKDQ